MHTVNMFHTSCEYNPTNHISIYTTSFWTPLFIYLFIFYRKAVKNKQFLHLLNSNDHLFFSFWYPELVSFTLASLPLNLLTYLPFKVIHWKLTAYISLKTGKMELFKYVWPVVHVFLHISFVIALLWKQYIGLALECGR